MGYILTREVDMNPVLYYLFVGAAIFALLVYALWDFVAERIR